MRSFKRQRRKEQVYDIYSKDTFAKNFRKYFRKSGMTVRKFLKLSGVGKSAFYNWINGKNIPYMRNIETIRREIKYQLDNCSFNLYDVDINLAALRRIDKKISEIESSKIFKYIKED